MPELKKVRIPAQLSSEMEDHAFHANDFITFSHRGKALAYVALFLLTSSQATTTSPRRHVQVMMGYLKKTWSVHQVVLSFFLSFGGRQAGKMWDLTFVRRGKEGSGCLSRSDHREIKCGD